MMLVAQAGSSRKLKLGETLKSTGMSVLLGCTGDLNFLSRGKEKGTSTIFRAIGDE